MLHARSRHTHPTRSPDLSISHVFSQPEKNLPQSTEKPRLVSHTLAAKSPQGRGGDEAECLLVTVKFEPQSFSLHSQASVRKHHSFSLRGFFIYFFAQNDTGVKAGEGLGRDFYVQTLMLLAHGYILL